MNYDIPPHFSQPNFSSKPQHYHDLSLPPPFTYHQPQPVTQQHFYLPTTPAPHPVPVPSPLSVVDTFSLPTAPSAISHVSSGTQDSSFRYTYLTSHWTDGQTLCYDFDTN
jgi:hypothetical protein